MSFANSYSKTLLFSCNTAVPCRIWKLAP